MSLDLGGQGDGNASPDSSAEQKLKDGVRGVGDTAWSTLPGFAGEICGWVHFGSCKHAIDSAQASLDKWGGGNSNSSIYKSTAGISTVAAVVVAWENPEIDAAAAEEVGAGFEETLTNFGNASGPKAGRPKDFAVASGSDAISGYHPTAPTDDIPGASTYTEPGRTTLTGHMWSIPSDTTLPEGLGVHADGADVGGNAPWGHRTIYPTGPMSFGDFQGLVKSLPWEFTGRVK